MQVRRFKMPHAALQQLPKSERAFFLLSGHIQNELSSLNKVFAWCLQNKDSKSQLESLANGVQAQIYARLLAGKLFEAWRALEKAYFGANIARKVETSLQPVAMDALKNLKAYFSKSNQICRIRNSFASHYDAEDYEQNWLQVVDHPHFEVVLGGTLGNNINLGSELVVNVAVLSSANQPDEAVALQTFLDDVRTMADYFTTFFEGVALVFLEAMLPLPLRDQCNVEFISPPVRFEDVAIPHFYNHGLPDI